MDYPEVMTIRQAAGFLQMHYQTVYALVVSKEIPASQVGKAWRIQKVDLIAYLNSRK